MPRGAGRTTDDPRILPHPAQENLPPLHVRPCPPHRRGPRLGRPRAGPLLPIEARQWDSRRPIRIQHAQHPYEGSRAWVVTVILGAAVALGSILVGRQFASGKRPHAALGAALLFAGASAGLGYATVAASSRWVVLLDERARASQYDLHIVGGLVIVTVVALTGTILAGVLTVNWAIAFDVRRSAMRSTEAFITVARPTQRT